MYSSHPSPKPLRPIPDQKPLRRTLAQGRCAEYQARGRARNTLPEAVRPVPPNHQCLARGRVPVGSGGPCLGNTWPETVHRLWDKQRSYPGPKPLHRIPTRSRCAQYLTRSRCVELWPEAGAPSTWPEAMRAMPDPRQLLTMRHSSRPCGLCFPPRIRSTHRSALWSETMLSGTGPMQPPCPLLSLSPKGV